MRTVIYRASTARHWRQARRLLTEHLHWVADAIGFDVTTRQPSAGSELANPARFYRPPDGILVLAGLGGRPAGIVGVRRLDGRAGELKRMFVRPAARGHGVGTALVAEAVIAAGDLGLAELRLETDPTSMGTALRLYRAAGFTDIQPYGNLGIDGLVTLGLQLDPSRATPELPATRSRPADPTHQGGPSSCPLSPAPAAGSSTTAGSRMLPSAAR